jgi:mercuric ion transport protein
MNHASESRRGLTVATSAIGAFAAAGLGALASLCCAGPAVLAVLGTSGAVAAAGLAEYRPYLLLLAFAVLGFGFWQAYRPVATGPACAIRTGRAIRVILWSSLAATLVAAVLPYFLND